MEDRWHGPEDPTNEEPETTRKKRRGSDFLSQYLLRRREQQGEKIEEDDEESEEKPKKFRRFFKGLFKNVVEPPFGDPEPTPNRFGLEALFLGTQKEHESNVDSLNADIEDKTELKPDFSVARTESTAEPYELESAPQESSTEKEEETPQPEAAVHIPAAELAQEEEPVSERTYGVPRPYEQVTDQTVYERPTTQPTEKEVVIERGAGMALPVVLVGAEYLARKKADRKLDAKYNEKVSRLESDANRQSLVTEQLDTLVKQNREQLAALKRDRGIETPKVEQRPPALERPATHVEQKLTEQQPLPQSVLEKQPQYTPEMPKEQDTHKIMEQVADAAEHDVPVERVFERSHEVKDDQSSHVGAASIGTIMSAKVADERLGGYNPPTRQLQDENGLPVIPDKVQSAMYRQAIRSGFWAAIIIIILGTIAYLLK